MSMNPVVHFEMPGDNTKRMSAFYKRAFGWKTKQLGPEMGHYVLAKTSECDKKGYPKEKARINGGFCKRSECAQHPNLVIAVPDLNKALKKVKAAGGKPLGPSMEIPGVGLYAMFHDTEGNRVAMLQPVEM